MLQGSWAGVIKDIGLRVANETDVTIDDDNFFLMKNYFIDSLGVKILMPNSNKLYNRYRIFIHSSDDTIMERKPSIMESLYKEPTYSKVHFVNKNVIRLFFLFKYNESILLELKIDKDGCYLKRVK